MPEKLLPPVTLDMLRPSEDRSLDTNLRLLRFIGCFTGRGSLTLYRWIRKGWDLSDEDAQEMNYYIHCSIKSHYKLPQGTSPEEFYLNARKGPRRLIEHVGDLLPELKQSFELKDELINSSENPSDFFWYLSRPPKLIDKTLEFELQRDLVLSHISALINARTLRGKSRTVLADIQKLFIKGLFAPPIGGGENFFLESVHDDETNEVLGFREDMDHIPLTAHLKRRRFTVRTIPNIGYVYTSPRKKDDWTTMIKLLNMAQYTNKPIDISLAQDCIAMMFVPMDPHQDPEEVADRVVSVMQSGPKEIDHIDRENNVDTYGGQASNFTFGDRRKIWFRDDPVPFELVVQDATRYLNSELEVGTRDRETGIYNGRAHILREYKRLIPILPLLFPPEIYDRDPEVRLDLDKVVVNRMQLVAQERREMYKVA